MAENIKYLTRQELIKINQYAVEMVGGITFGVRSDAGLDAIVKQPKQVVFGRELYLTIWLKAACILQEITKKHVFIDGNKRTAMQAAMYFLHLNGYDARNIDAINDSDNFVLSVINSPDSEATMVSIATWLQLNFVER